MEGTIQSVDKWAHKAAELHVGLGECVRIICHESSQQFDVTLRYGLACGTCELCGTLEKGQC